MLPSPILVCPIFYVCRQAAQLLMYLLDDSLRPFQEGGMVPLGHQTAGARAWQGEANSQQTAQSSREGPRLRNSFPSGSPSSPVHPPGPYRTAGSSPWKGRPSTGGSPSSRPFPLWVLRARPQSEVSATPKIPTRFRPLLFSAPLCPASVRTRPSVFPDLTGFCPVLSSPLSNLPSVCECLVPAQSPVPRVSLS